MTDRVLLITKTDFSVPHDGGTMRVAAIVEALQDAGLVVDSVAVRSAEGKRQRSTFRARPSCIVSPSWWSAVGKVGTSTLRTASLSVARWFSTAVAEQISRLLRENTYSAVIIEFSQLLIYRSLFDGVPVILDMHNIEHEMLENYAASAKTKSARWLATYEAVHVRNLERRALDLVDAVVTVSDRDAQLIEAAADGNAIVVTAPNGVTDDAFTVVPVPTVPPTVVFIAHLGWRPNIDATHWLVRHVWPLIRQRCPTAVLQLVGRQPASEVMEYDGIDGVTVHPDVPSTLPYLAQAVVATAPLKAAGGTRLKIIEAMATGTPVVATALGALGLEGLAENGSMAIADEPEEFAAAVAYYIEAPHDVGRTRREVEPYRWRKALEPLVDLVDDARLGKRFSGDRRAATGRSNVNSTRSE